MQYHIIRIRGVAGSDLLQCADERFHHCCSNIEISSLGNLAICCVRESKIETFLSAVKQYSDVERVG